MTARIDGELRLSTTTADRTYSAAHVAAILDSVASVTRTTQTVYYLTASAAPTVYFTALATNGTSVLVARTTTGVTAVGGSLGLYKYVMDVTGGRTDFLAVWDEGDPSVFYPEGVVVDT